MPGKGQESVTLPKDLIDEVNETIKDNPGLYGNKTEFVKDSIRQHILKLRSKRNKPKKRKGGKKEN